MLFVSAALALNYPFLGLFDRAWMPFGIPLLYFYLYLIWFLVIVLLIVTVEHSEIHEPGEPAPSAPTPENSAPPETAARTKASGVDPTESP